MWTGHIGTGARLLSWNAIHHGRLASSCAFVDSVTASHVIGTHARARARTSLPLLRTLRTLG